jgi:hypothetical protein
MIKEYLPYVFWRLVRLLLNLFYPIGPFTV